MINIAYNGERDKVAFKDIFASVIPELCETRDDVIYLDADLMSCIGTYKWAKTRPDKAINCGISESNMVGVAAGLAASGFKPIVHSFGPFASRRVFDQVFLSAAYAGNDITVIGSDPGVCAMYNGGTHMPFEDTGLYRTVPGATVIDVADTVMLRDVLKKCVDMKGVKYIRVGRKNNGKIYGDGSEFEIGKAVELRKGGDAVIFACGIMVFEAMKAAETLAAEGIETAVVDVFTVKPIDAEAVLKYALETGAVVVTENHNRIGGLVSAVSETLAGKFKGPFGYVAVEDEFGEVGTLGYLQERFGLTAEHLADEVRRAVNAKK